MNDRMSEVSAVRMDAREERLAKAQDALHEANLLIDKFVDKVTLATLTLQILLREAANEEVPK